MKKLTIKFIIPLTVISFVLLQKWWYVLVVDGTKEIMYGFPLIYTCKGFHTSMSYQFFILEFLVDILVFFTFWILIFYFLKKLKFLFRYQKTISIVLYVFTSILLCFETLVLSNPNNLFKIKRNFEIENIESGFKFLWQNKNFNFEKKFFHINSFPQNGGIHFNFNKIVKNKAINFKLIIEESPLTEMLQNSKIILDSKNEKVRIKKNNENSFELFIDSSFDSNIISFDVNIIPNIGCFVSTYYTKGFTKHPDKLNLYLKNYPIN